MSDNGHVELLIGCEPMCGWQWYRWSLTHTTQAMIDSLGLEISVEGRNLPRVQTGNDRYRRKEIMQVVKSYRKGG